MKNQNNHYTLKYINKKSKCAEVGVWEGDLSLEILKREPLELHLIDPWKSQDAIERCYSIEQSKMDQIYKNVLNDFDGYDEVTIHRKFSTEVFFPKHYFDWVYIDGDHSYNAVKKDLAFYYPLIKKGGYLCGDDYGLWNDRPKTGFGSDGGGGPKPAVDEFVKENNLNFEISKNQFVIFV